MAKLNLAEIVSGYLSGASLNSILASIETAMEKVLWRDGTAPNAMEADLDLGGHKLLNVESSPTDPLSVPTWGDLTSYLESVSSGYVVQHVEKQDAVAAQTLFNLTTMSYEPGSNNLAVYVDGVRKFTPADYVETDADTVMFNAGMVGGEVVTFISNEFLGTIELESHNHPWAQITNVPDYASRWPTYAEVTDKPTTFTPASHTHAATDITSGRMADAQRGVWVQATQPTSPQVGDVWLW